MLQAKKKRKRSKLDNDDPAKYDAKRRGRTVTWRNQQRKPLPQSDSHLLYLRFPEVAREWVEDSNAKLGLNLQTVVYACTLKAWWCCRTNSACGNVWQATIYSRSWGAGCPVCGGNTVTDKNRLSILRPDLLVEWDYEKNEYSPETYSISSHRLAWWKCRKPECGHHWKATICNRARNGTACPGCSGHAVTDRNRLSVVCPRLMVEWDFEKNEQGPDKYGKGSRYNAWWICRIADCRYNWRATVYERARRGGGCPACNRRVVSDKNRLSILKPELVKEWDFEKNEQPPDHYSVSSHSKVWWKCSVTECQHSWEASIDNRSKDTGTGCPACALRIMGYMTSKTEQRMVEAVRQCFSLSADVQLQDRPLIEPDVVQTVNLQRGSGFRYSNVKPDVYLHPDQSDTILKPIFIEFDSLLFHRDEAAFVRDSAKTDILLSIHNSLVFRIRDRLPSLDYQHPDKARYIEICLTGSAIYDESLMFKTVEQIYDCCVKHGAVVV